MIEQIGDPALWTATCHTMFEADSPVGKALLDADMRYLAINPALALFNGVDAERTLGRTVAEVLPDAYPTIEPLLRRVLEHGEPQQNFRVSLATGAPNGAFDEWEASYLPVFLPDGRVGGVYVQAINISLKVRAERVLRESESLLRRVLDGLFTFVGILTPDGTLVNANRAPLEAAGIRLEDVVGQPFWETYWFQTNPELQQWLRDSVREVAAGGHVRRDIVVRMAEDTRMTIDFSMVPLRDEQGRVTQLIPSAIDVSPRLASEEALRASELRFRTVFESAPEGMALLDQEGVIELANLGLAKVLGVLAHELLGRRIACWLPELDILAPQAHGHLSTPREISFVRADGQLVTVTCGMTSLPFERPKRMLLTLSDVSTFKRTQSALESAVREKTVLLQEVHHRVKNNLQIISSLLRLQARQAGPDVQAALQDCQNRVVAMALTHQLLYEMDDFASLDLGPYVHRLCSSLRDSHADLCRHVELRVNMPEQTLKISLTQAVSMALIVNELITNALKHAFAGRDSGSVEVRGLSLADGALEIAVVDNGIGLPPRATDGDGSLGFTLIQLLSAQVGATLSINSTSNGTQVSLRLRHSGDAHE